MSSPSTPSTSTPSTLTYTLSFLLVGICWGFTTPFIRRAAVNYTPPSDPSITDPARSYLSRKLALLSFTVLGLLRRPQYAIPLVANLTGSIWFFLLVGQAGTLVFSTLVFLIPCHTWWGACMYVLLDCANRTRELSLTVPITNSLAFLFTVLGEYLAEGKLITRDTWLGMGLVCGGIALCVISKL